MPFLMTFLARQPQRLLPLTLLIFQPLLADLVHVPFVSEFRQRLLAEMMPFNDLLLLRLDFLLNLCNSSCRAMKWGSVDAQNSSDFFSTSMKFFFFWAYGLH